ncbi:MAG TPA: ABC transporter permease [Acidimicrobiales bacterium]|nr:ABC transporter permease [Acidimicrobiales bacterium]
MDLARRLDPAGVPRSDVITVITPEVNVLARVRDIWRYRELLLGLVGKELKVKYKGSAIGFLWSMLNPALTLAIFYFIFQIVLQNRMPYFAIFLMTGLLVYNLFSYACMNATGTMVGNAGIVKKVAFPREILALASVLAGVVFFFFQALVLLVVLGAARYTHIAWGFLPLLIPAFIALVLFAAALSVFLAAVNVYFRDTQHLAEILIGSLWFWATPIVYQYVQIGNELAKHHLPSGLLLINPLTDIVLVFQRAIYGIVSYQANGSVVSLRPTLSGNQVLPVAGEWWYLWHVLVVLGLSCGLVLGALYVFGRLEGNFAEEL